MARSKKNILTLAAMLAVFVFFAGSVTYPQKAMSTGRYNFILQDGEDYSISNVYVSHKGKEYKIHGSVANRWSPKNITSGKIKITFVDSGGTEIDEIFVPIRISTMYDMSCPTKPCRRQTHGRCFR